MIDLAVSIIGHIIVWWVITAFALAAVSFIYASCEKLFQCVKTLAAHNHTGKT